MAAPARGRGPRAGRSRGPHVARRRRHGSARLEPDGLRLFAPRRPPLVIDHASSQTAYVNVRQAARTGASIPADWAVGPDGAKTTDASAALAGVLLPFGGYRGGNIALLVELLATLAGGSFSLEAAHRPRGGPAGTRTARPRPKITIDPELADRLHAAAEAQ
ncbi:Ldh family oxidoreductase [Streptomyces ipomoeae]|uniref:Ldh family oxidoreductase n=1 Tax=Streptomyces ipomoeae TaxID=103232 RepID=UPI00246819C4|nr:Ldh family oxidoreductase [Streptomyces ipomoeae]MDX2939479.1 Ldh family oxidoreductase [Streptomyces ipomoeae]